MAKRIALFLDGTWGSAEDQTNVLLMHDAVADVGQDGVAQRRKYLPGVGTRFGEIATGGILGWGLDRNVREAYEYLVNTYEEGDKIYLFGFSRGAYTARSLAGMIVKCGLLKEGSAADVLWLWHYYADEHTRRRFDIYQDRKRKGIQPNSDEAWILDRCANRNIEVIGIWDTVGSLGVPFGNITGLSRRSYQFHNTRPSTFYKHCFHALAIDEYRKDFSPTFLTRFLVKQTPPVIPKNERPVIEQRWFAGSHSNVGGGIAGNRLSQFSLKWMMDCAAGKSLEMRSALALDPAGLADRTEDSLGEFLGGLYRRLRPNARHVRTIGSPPIDLISRSGVEGRGVIAHEVIDASVFDRVRLVPGYRPDPLVAWAGRRGLRLEDIRGDQIAQPDGP